MKNNVALPESITFSCKPPFHQQLTASAAAAAAGEYCWFDDACIFDMDYFVKTIAEIKAKGIRPDLIGSIIAHYASKWLPDLSGSVTAVSPGKSNNYGNCHSDEPTESVTASVMKKRFFVETLIGILPPEKDSMPCNFLLRLLRTANMVVADPAYRTELETRISWQLDQASLKELMIPSFSHTCGTLLDVELVTRLVKKFVGLDSEGVKSGAALVKVAKLVDSYLAEAAVDANFSLPEFIALAGALPSHARVTEDGLYRAVDTYLKAHPQVSKHERKALCRLIDSRKLSTEAAFHAAQNERLPVRAVIQVLFSEQNKLSRHIEWSSSFSGARSPIPSSSLFSDAGPARCLSKREMNTQQAEIKKLREDLARLQSQCGVMRAQLEKLVEKKGSSSSKGFFRWRKLGIMPSIRSTGVSVSVEEVDDNGEGDDHFKCEPQTPANMKTRLVKGRTTSRWRKSMS